MQHYLLDTHVILWMADAKKRVPAPICNLEDHHYYASVCSIFEATFKKYHGKIRADVALMFEKLGNNNVKFLPVTKEDAELAGTLPNIHGDPIDRFIIAQAKNRNLTLVTADSYIPQYPVKTLER